MAVQRVVHPRSSKLAVLTLCALAANACRTVSVFVTPEGNLAVGPPRAGAGPHGYGGNYADESNPPQPHVSRSAFDTWRPPPLGVLPPGAMLHNTSVPLRLNAGPLALTLRASDRIVPAWGGDLYVRVDMDAGAAPDQPSPRDLAVVIDSRDGHALNRARRLAASVFETLRGGDRGALVSTSDSGRVLVPLLPYGAAPLLVERASSFVAENDSDVEAALGRAVPLLASNDRSRLRRLIVLWTDGSVITAETREWLQAATRDGIEVSLAPLTRSAAARLHGLEGTIDAAILPQVGTDDRDEHDVVEELSALPPADLAAEGVTLAVDSLPGPMHLLEVAGATPVWTPSGGEVPLGDVRVGDRRTLVLRGTVPPWRAPEPLVVTLHVRFHDEQGDHDVSRTLSAAYSESPMIYAASRAGDVLQYVSLLNTLSTVQAALVRHDADMLAALQEPATLQARSLELYAREHRDGVMNDQAELLLGLLADVDLAAPPPSN